MVSPLSPGVVGLDDEQRRVYIIRREAEVHEIPLSRVRYDQTFRLLGTGEVDEPGEPRGSSPTLKPVHKAEKSKPNSIRDPTSHWTWVDETGGD